MGTHKFHGKDRDKYLAKGTVNESSAVNVKDAIDKKHTQDTDTQLGLMAADIDMNSHQLGSLSVPDANGEAIRQTTKITEVSLEDAVDKKHAQNTDTDLDATFEATFVKKVDTVNVLSDITSPGVDIEDAVTKKHTHTDQHLDLGTGELKIKVFAQATEPTLNADEYMAIWKDTGEADRIYLLFRRGVGDQVAVELTEI